MTATRKLMTLISLAAFVISGCSATGEPDRSPPLPADRPSVVDAIDREAANPSPEAESSVSGDRSKAAAVAAALAYLEATEEVVALSAVDAGDVMREFAATSDSERLAGRVEEAMVALALSAPMGVQVWVAPVAWRADPTSAGFEVSVWLVEVVAVERRSVVAQWKTAVVSLVWEAGAWKVSDSAMATGPIPEPAPSATSTRADQFLASLAGFSDSEGAAR